MTKDGWDAYYRQKRQYAERQAKLIPESTKKQLVNPNTHIPILNSQENRPSGRHRVAVAIGIVGVAAAFGVAVAISRSAEAVPTPPAEQVQDSIDDQKSLSGDETDQWLGLRIAIGAGNGSEIL